MREDFEQFLATIIEQCLDEHDMQPPLVVRTVGDNGSVLVAGFNEGAGPLSPGIRTSRRRQPDRLLSLGC